MVYFKFFMPRSESVWSFRIGRFSSDYPGYYQITTLQTKYIM